MSSDVIRYFTKGWNKNLIAFNGQITLGQNIGSQLSHLHTNCGWTFWSDQNRFRWDEPLLRSHDCTTHIWFHHLNIQKIKMFRWRHVKRRINGTNSNEKKVSVNNTGCGWKDGLPPFENLKRVTWREANSKIEAKPRSRMSKLIEADFSKPIPPCTISRRNY